MTPPSKDKHRCEGTTKKGEQCQAWALKGTKRCRKHPDSPDAATRARNERWDRQGFLNAFHLHGMVSAACQEIGVSRATVYAERERNEVFAEKWADVEEEVVESMEYEALRRARDGVTKPLVSAGKHVCDVTEYSDSLLQFLLKARRPHVYRERVDVTHAGKLHHGGKVEFVAPDEEEKRQGVAQILAEVGAVNGNGNGNGH